MLKFDNQVVSKKNIKKGCSKNLLILVITEFKNFKKKFEKTSHNILYNI